MARPTTKAPKGAATAQVVGSARMDSHFTTTGTQGLTNARTRIVGDRTGLLADAVIATVRFLTAARGLIARIFRRLAGVITPLGWSVLAAVPLTLGIG